MFLKIDKKYLIVKIQTFLRINRKVKKDLQANLVVSLLINKMKSKMYIWTCINNRIQKTIKIQLTETISRSL